MVIQTWEENPTAMFLFCLHYMKPFILDNKEWLFRSKSKSYNKPYRELWEHWNSCLKEVLHLRSIATNIGMFGALKEYMQLLLL